MRTPVCYTIRVEGLIGKSWSSWFEGMTIEHQEGGETILRGPLLDEAALYGVLTKIRDLGLPLVELKRTEAGAKAPREPEQGE